MPRRSLLALVAALAMLAPAGCGSGSGSGKAGATLRAYASLPLRGASAGEGQAIEDGMKLALTDAGGSVGGRKIEAVYLDDTRGTGEWDQATVGANARRATQDIAAIGYLGDLESGATRVSLPITNQAELAQVSPASTAVDLTRSAGGKTPQRLQPSNRQTFARVVPADDAQAHAAAAWAKKLGAKAVTVISDGSAFGKVLATAFGDEAGRLGLKTRERQAAAKGCGATSDFVYLAGTGGALLNAAGCSKGAAVGSDALLSQSGLPDGTYLTSPFIDTSKLPPAGRRFAVDFRKRFGRAPAPAAAYGYESMALLLDSIHRAGSNGGDRSKVIDALLATRNRNSILGRYSIDEFGDTTLTTISGYRVKAGKPAFDALLQAPSP